MDTETENKFLWKLITGTYPSSRKNIVVMKICLCKLSLYQK